MLTLSFFRASRLVSIPMCWKPGWMAAKSLTAGMPRIDSGQWAATAQATRVPLISAVLATGRAANEHLLADNLGCPDGDDGGRSCSGGASGSSRRNGLYDDG